MIQKNKYVVVRDVGHVTFLIDTKKSYNRDGEYLFQVNEIGKIIWESIEDNETLERLTNKVIERMDNEKTEEFIFMVKKDIEDFLYLLSENQMVRGY